VNSGAPEGCAVPAPLVTPVVFKYLVVLDYDYFKKVQSFKARIFSICHQLLTLKRKKGIYDKLTPYNDTIKIVL
jgi:hypothetical protein